MNTYTMQEDGVFDSLRKGSQSVRLGAQSSRGYEGDARGSPHQRPVWYNQMA